MKFCKPLGREWQTLSVMRLSVVIPCFLRPKIHHSCRQIMYVCMYVCIFSTEAIIQFSINEALRRLIPIGWYLDMLFWGTGGVPKQRVGYRPDVVMWLNGLLDSTIQLSVAIFFGALMLTNVLTLFHVIFLVHSPRPFSLEGRL